MKNPVRKLMGMGNRPFHEQMYIYILYLSWGLYLVALLGISFFSPRYLAYLREIVKIYISGVLIYKFNPFFGDGKKRYINDFDREIVFSAGIYLLLTTTITSVIEHLYSNSIIG